MDRVIDCHAHIQPPHQVKPEALKVIRERIGHPRELAEFLRSPRRFVASLDAIGIDQAWLINYVSPDVIGFTPEANDWGAADAKEFPDRLRPFGSVHPLVTPPARPPRLPPRGGTPPLEAGARRAEGAPAAPGVRPERLRGLSPPPRPPA